VKHCRVECAFHLIEVQRRDQQCLTNGVISWYKIMARAAYFVDHDAGLELNEHLLNIMDDLETSQMLDELLCVVGVRGLVLSG
jgi:hypothetical protein